MQFSISWGSHKRAKAICCTGKSKLRSGQSRSPPENFCQIEKYAVLGMYRYSSVQPDFFVSVMTFAAFCIPALICICSYHTLSIC